MTEEITGKIEREGMPEEIRNEIKKDIENKNIKKDDINFYKYVIMAGILFIVLIIIFKKK